MLFRSDRAVFTQTAITYAYELGLRCSLARWKANEKLRPKIAQTSSTSFRHSFGTLPCRCEPFRNDETIPEPCIQPTLLTMDLNLSPCKVQSQDLVHVNSIGVLEPKIPFCAAFTETAITFAYELGLRYLVTGPCKGRGSDPL